MSAQWQNETKQNKSKQIEANIFFLWPTNLGKGSLAGWLFLENSHVILPLLLRKFFIQAIKGWGLHGNLDTHLS